MFAFWAERTAFNYLALDRDAVLDRIQQLDPNSGDADIAREALDGLTVAVSVPLDRSFPRRDLPLIRMITGYVLSQAPRVGVIDDPTALSIAVPIDRVIFDPGSLAWVRELKGRVAAAALERVERFGPEAFRDGSTQSSRFQVGGRAGNAPMGMAPCCTSRRSTSHSSCFRENTHLRNRRTRSHVGTGRTRYPDRVRRAGAAGRAAELPRPPFARASLRIPTHRGRSISAVVADSDGGTRWPKPGPVGSADGRRLANVRWIEAAARPIIHASPRPSLSD